MADPMTDVEPGPDLAGEYDALLQFLYVCPHGMAQFDRSGGISLLNPAFACLAMPLRSEERRVGKECRSRWSPYH